MTLWTAINTLFTALLTYNVPVLTTCPTKRVVAAQNTNLWTRIDPNWSVLASSQPPRTEPLIPDQLWNARTPHQRNTVTRTARFRPILNGYNAVLTWGDGLGLFCEVPGATSDAEVKAQLLADQLSAPDTWRNGTKNKNMTARANVTMDSRSVLLLDANILKCCSFRFKWWRLFLLRFYNDSVFIKTEVWINKWINK